MRTMPRPAQLLQLLLRWRCSNHPKTAGTPFDATMYGRFMRSLPHGYSGKKNGDQNSMPVHVWRINTDASYNTFPTATS